MIISEVMTKDVSSLNVDDTIERAAQLMKQHNIGAVPVCSGEKVVGIITDRDIALRAVAEGENVKLQAVRTIMSSNPVLGNPDMDVHEAARIMKERQIRRLPIVENNNLVGVISLGDIATTPNLKNDAEEALHDISDPCTPTM